MIATKYTRLTSTEAYQLAYQYYFGLQVSFSKKFRLIYNTSSYLINIDADSKDCLFLYESDNNKYAFYFDSYGMPPPENIKTILQKNKYKLSFNCFVCQSLESDVCGYYCMVLLVKLNTLYRPTSKIIFNAFSNYVHLFSDDVDENDKSIIKLYNKL
jgi:hypothetical protein